jgi:hypothetical protein
MSTDTMLAALGLALPWITLFLLIIIYGTSNDID